MDLSAIHASFDLALRAHQSGNLRQAEQGYRQILQQQPGHAPALHLLGGLFYRDARCPPPAGLTGGGQRRP